MTVEINDIYDFLYWSLTALLFIFPSVILCFMVPRKKRFGIRIALYIGIEYLLIAVSQGMGIIVYNEFWMPWILRVSSVLIFFVCNKCTIKQVIYLMVWELSYGNLFAQLPGLIVTTVLNNNAVIPTWLMLKLICAVFVGIMIFLTFRHCMDMSIENISWREIIQASIFSISVIWLNGLMFRREAERTMGITGSTIFLMQIFSSLCVIMMLYLQVEINYRKHVQEDQNIRERLLELEKKHFEAHQKQIDIINRKCHDLKHQIAALENMHDETTYAKNIQELKEAVMVYDDSIYSGNLALQTILMEKKLQYEENNIVLNCVIDNVLIDFMDTVDLYILLGNILDNAFECVDKITSTEKRLVESRIYRDKKMLRMVFRNYYENDLHFKDGLPLTTKKNDGSHGFGCDSIRHTVKKYQGDMVINAQDNIFEMKIMIPMPEDYRTS